MVLWQLSSKHATPLNWAVCTTSWDLCQFAWLQCGTCQGPSHEQLQRTVVDIKAGRGRFCNSTLAESELCVYIPFLESGEEPGEKQLRLVLRPGDIVLSQLQVVTAIRSHDKCCGTTPACPDLTISHLSGVLQNYMVKTERCQSRSRDADGFSSS